MGTTFVDQEHPLVCVCPDPRFDGSCNCNRSHWPGECRGCHRLYKPQFAGFIECRTAWQRQLEATRG